MLGSGWKKHWQSTTMDPGLWAEEQRFEDKWDGQEAPCGKVEWFKVTWWNNGMEWAGWGFSFAQGQ